MIIVVGAGQIGTALGAFEDVTLFSRQKWEEMTEGTRAFMLKDASVFVNCVAITGDTKCRQAGYDTVMSVNVDKAVKYAQQVSAEGVPVVMLSTRGVYARQSMPKQGDFPTVVGMRHSEAAVFGTRVGEAVYPHNLYCASKLLMEQAIPSARHLRIPIFWETLLSRREQWRVVQDTYTSYLKADRLHECLHLLSGASPGIYQCQSRIIYLPDMFPNLPIRKEVPSGMTASVPLIESDIFGGLDTYDEEYFDFVGWEAWEAHRQKRLDDTQLGCAGELAKTFEFKDAHGQAQVGIQS